MTAEDQEFLTRVMEEGIRNDSTRMREIMFDIASYLEESFEESKSSVEPGQGNVAAAGTTSSSSTSSVAASKARAAARAAAAAEAFRRLDREEQDTQIEIELDELQDIVEQIDMAQDFVVHMKGAECILDLVEDKKGLVGNMGVRCKACVVLGTLTQNNAKVQDNLFQNGIIGRLASLAVGLLTLPAPHAAAASLLPSPETSVSSLAAAGGLAGAAAAAAPAVEPPLAAASVYLGFRAEASEGGDGSAAPYTLLAKVLYALSCAVRSHALAEEVFVRGQFGPAILRAILMPALHTAVAGNASSSSGSGTDDATRALHHAVSTCRCKAIFLSNALLASDTLSSEAKTQLLEGVLPHCLAALADSSLIQAAHGSYSALGYDSADLREQTLQLLKNAIRLPEHVGVGAVCRTSTSSAGAGAGSGRSPIFRIQDVLVGRIRTLTAASIALRRRLAEQPASSATDQEECTEALQRNESELASLNAVRRALTPAE